MEQRDRFEAALRRSRRRFAFQRWLRNSLIALFYALIVCCAWVILTRLFPILGTPEPVCLALVLVALAAASGWTVYRYPTLLRTALEMDRQLGLQERLTSSLQLMGVEGAMVEALHQDARFQLTHADLTKLFPLSPPWSVRWMAVPLICFGLAYTLLPEFDLFGYQQRRAEAMQQQQATKATAERIASAARVLREAVPEDRSSELAAAAGEIDQIAEKLNTGELTDKQALTQLAKLSDALAARREKLDSNAPTPKLASGAEQLGRAAEVAKEMQKGDFGEAAQKARELQEKLKEGKLSEAEKNELLNDLKKLAEKLGGESSNSQLAEALAKLGLNASAALGDPNAMSGLNQLELSLEDIASILEQLDKLDKALLKLAECKQNLLGPSEYCRKCGAKLQLCKHGKHCKACVGSCGTGLCAGCTAGIGGNWAKGDGPIGGGGMGRRGTGRGGSTGELPDVDAEFEPTMLTGPQTTGKMLANILQRTAPEPGAEPTTDYVAGALVQVQQEAEQALTKEEIPPGSKEFVRQYFGTLEEQERVTSNEQ